MANDSSGTITTGGTAQNLVFNPSDGTTPMVPASGFSVYNPDPTNDLWVAENGRTAVANGVGCVRVPANGGWYETPQDKIYRVTGLVSIVGAVTGQKFTAKNW